MNERVYRFSRFLMRAILAMWNRHRIAGADHVPLTGGVLLVANHASYIDPPAVGCRLRRPVHYLARATLGKLGFVHRYLRALGVIFVDLDGSPREGLTGAIDALNSGRAVCIFPEGTRSPDGAIKEFKRGALLLLKRARVPVVPVGLEGSFAALRRGHWFLRPARVTVRYGAPMTSAEVLAAGGVEELRRRVMALAGQVPGAPVGVGAVDAPERERLPRVVLEAASSRAAPASAATASSASSTSSSSTAAAPAARTVDEPSSVVTSSVGRTARTVDDPGSSGRPH